MKPGQGNSSHCNAGLWQDKGTWSAGTGTLPRALEHQTAPAAGFWRKDWLGDENRLSSKWARPISIPRQQDTWPDLKRTMLLTHIFFSPCSPKLSGIYWPSKLGIIFSPAIHSPSHLRPLHRHSWLDTRKLHAIISQTTPPRMFSPSKLTGFTSNTKPEYLQPFEPFYWILQGNFEHRIWLSGVMWRMLSFKDIRHISRMCLKFQPIHKSLMKQIKVLRSGAGAAAGPSPAPSFTPGPRSPVASSQQMQQSRPLGKFSQSSCLWVPAAICKSE